MKRLCNRFKRPVRFFSCDEFFWIPACAGMTEEWIPAFAGMTNLWILRHARMTELRFHVKRQNKFFSAFSAIDATRYADRPG